MDMGRKDEFMRLWTKHFDRADLPIVFYYTDESGRAGVGATSPRQSILAQARAPSAS